MTRPVLVIASALFVTTLSAQVANDSCLSAIDLGVFGGSQTETCIDGMNIYDTVSYANNSNAVPNYPYLSMTGCAGYTNTTASAANDIWFKFKAARFEIKVFAAFGIDTLHLLVWKGDSCSNLSPVACYTADTNILSGFLDTIFCGTSIGNEYVYLQLSGSVVGDTGSFGMCLRSVGAGPCFGGFVQQVDTLCFEHSISYTDSVSWCTDNGSASIVVGSGNQPYSFLWSDGNTENSRSDLSAGQYYVTITDAGGCSKVDSITLIQEPAMTASITTAPATCTTCADGCITIIPSGGCLPYTVNTIPADPFFTPCQVTPNTYVIEVCDNCNCCIQDTVTVDSLSVGLTEVKQKQLAIYPNPTTGLITVTGLSEEATRITGYNVLGELVYDRPYTNQHLNLTYLPVGVYSLRITQGKNVFRKRIIKVF